ncbi:hypothetical protein AVI51_13345 [Piscirickettsia salmonis]|uniref:DUF559 domain-containing protein n=1 Tax=Piscirickettsia salmonis TaxID=1238 RepID=A0A9Q6LJP2_PISSA|nr:hypothetical protein [Piscirickettsia salmonis]APS51736.1 hypothetical protein AVI50_13465 [Piscirickettsia salmonis]APS54954.1 hypothetical protein AVI51_13345 [Piscirickettsia salmonis]QGN93997.1 hypothetical protein Psal006a_00568 [Piscirickettsia salmonis]QGO04940.1 hypothetical protein Psal009_00819 [Piscirickettsia salmonis]QGO33261.1 hypothetical protein Psal028_00566 [Piscirickettsia salmonis]
MRKRISLGERAFELHCRLEKITLPEQEYRFHKTRKWRFDFAWPDLKIAVEVEGGTYSQGRHTRGKGFEADCEKYNTATESGWLVFRYSTQQVSQYIAIRQLKRVLEKYHVDD